MLVIALCVLLAPAFAATDEEGYYIGARNGVDVLAAPRTGSKVMGRLERMTDVRVVKKQRAWWKIETIHGYPALQGWVREGAVRKRYQPSARKKTSSSVFAALSSIFGRPAPKQQTAVLGVRGLEDEGGDIASQQARQSAKESVRWMEGLSVSNEEVADFIREGDLNP
ncbi:MAG: SH3 domain-containing protein [Mariprofundaceae bacterium]|nr:SH3 domain-containing protein [Mariprofundaceae bacterium]